MHGGGPNPKTLEQPNLKKAIVDLPSPPRPLAFGPANYNSVHVRTIIGVDGCLEAGSTAALRSARRWEGVTPIVEGAHRAGRPH